MGVLLGSGPGRTGTFGEGMGASTGERGGAGH